MKLTQSASEQLTGPILRTRSSTYFRRPSGLIHRIVDGAYCHSLSDAREDVLAFDMIAKCRSQALLIEAHQPFVFGQGVRDYFRGEEACQWLDAAAIVTRWPLHRWLLRGLLGLKKPGFPCEVFASVDEAETWLSQRAYRPLRAVA